MSERALAVFDTPEQALRARRMLRREGFPRAAITIMSSVPIHFEETDDDGPKSLIWLFALAGAVIGAVSALLLTVLASKRMGLVVGGMPIVSLWPFGIITFELTALGAILAAFARMIIEARLARPNALASYDISVAEVIIVLHVQCEGGVRRAAAERILSANGAQIRNQ